MIVLWVNGTPTEFTVAEFKALNDVIDAGCSFIGSNEAPTPTERSTVQKFYNAFKLLGE